ncbi:Tricarboxylate transport membrane protein TctA [Polaromonas sp. CG9_12]|nr:Tricarboxylate transport membrane protein TctA [Polaromonas sp. CG9_12]
MSKKFSKEPEKFGTGHPEGIVESGAANNSSLAGAWIPALVFGIPGDSITAIVIGVLYMKNLNPGPMIFIENPVAMYAVFIVFHPGQSADVAPGLPDHQAGQENPEGPAQHIDAADLLFCIVGAYSINNSAFDVGIMLAFGLLAYLMEENGFPIAPTILGVVLGGMLEETFVSSDHQGRWQCHRIFQSPDCRHTGRSDFADMVSASRDAHVQQTTTQQRIYMMDDLKDKVVLITGASTGIGAACALAFGAQGCKVVVHFHSSKAARWRWPRLLNRLAARRVVQGDLRLSTDCERLVAESAMRFSRIDVLINNAGALVKRVPIDELSDQFDDIVGLNVRSMMMCTKYAVAHMRAAAVSST